MRKILIAAVLAVVPIATADAGSSARLVLSGDPILSRDADWKCQRDATCIPLIVNTSGTTGAKEIFRLEHGGRICGPLRIFNPENGAEVFSLAAGVCYPVE